MPEPGEATEATLWGLVGRLRARGWHISLWEIQRAQDVIAFLYARLRRPPTDEELRRHLQPIFCAHDRELALFAEAFRDSLAAPETEAVAERAAEVWRRRIPALLVAVAAVAALVGTLASVNPVVVGPTPIDPADGAREGTDPRWTNGLWTLVVVLAAASVAAAVIAFRKRLRRRPAAALRPSLDLGWQGAPPLHPDDCARVARVLRARTREPGRATIDVPRTVDATIRAGIRLTPQFVEYKRAPEFLAVIEQRSARDVLAGHYTRLVDQLGAHGVAVRRVGLQPSSQLVVDPQRGPRQLETLQPASERERLLLFAPDWSLRDPLTGADRPWLARFELWAETIRIDPDVHHSRPLRVVDRVLEDVRGFDAAWARERIRPVRRLPAVFETGDQLWIEPVPPPHDELVRVMELLVTTLGPAGWYWLGACAIYPEISYELTVALGRLLRADDGLPLADHLPLEVLARLPWFRHAAMPDWLRATLIGTMSRGQLVEARTALDHILSSGLAGSHAGLSIAEPSPAGDPGPAVTDRVYLEGAALRRRKLAAAAPKPLVAAIRRQRYRLTMTGFAADAPATRVRRALIAGNALLVALVLLITLGCAMHLWNGWTSDEAGYLEEEWGDHSFWPSIVVYGTLPGVMAAGFSGALSAAAGRRRGTLLGAGLLLVLSLALCGFLVTPVPDVLPVLLVAEPIVALLWTFRVLSRHCTNTVVSWVTFQRRNRRLYIAGLTAAVLAATTATLADRNVGPLGDLLDSDWLVVLAIVLIFAGLAIGLGAAYCGGVRIVPIGAAAAVLLGILVAATDGDSLVVVYALAAPAVALVVAFALLMNRFREQPPAEFWETRWYEWKRPLLIGVPAAATLITWIFSEGEVTGTAWIFGITATFAVLNVAGERIAAHVARHRLGPRSPLHLD